MQGQVASEQILFTRGVPAVEALPNKLISECMQAALEGPDGKTILQYGHNGGYLPLRQMLSEEYAAPINDIMVSNGSLFLLDLLAPFALQRGDTVFVEQPSYDRAIKTFRRCGARVVGIPLEHDGVDLHKLEQALAEERPALMYVIPDFQNPTGITTSIEKRQALVDLAAKYLFWLVEDIPYHLLRYRGEALPLLRELDTSYRVITISSYSKLISPALRVGYLIGRPDLVAQMVSLSEDTVLTPTLPSQAAALEFHRRGYFTSNLANLKQLYAPRLQAMVQALKTYLPNVPFAEPDGGFFVSITLPEHVESSNLLARAAEIGVILSDGRGFFPRNPLDTNKDHPGERFIRLPFCALTPAQIEEGVKRLATLIQ